ncbi:hypothetical protein [Pontibacter oryzae]|uniref:GAF domain-containing protein n=1 Tax=Pontibacter oryzae TaxID=2304593 RepID=A0A399S0T6_9BACT|nr:hypothetical protein [Pontibacter oryzae]RIJ36908.1 hypothetical protein D1627_13875 [Pontibacter oryzae]
MNYHAVYKSQKEWTTEEELTLNQAVGFVNSYQGDNFFYDTCLFINKMLDVKYVLIGKVVSDTYAEVKTLGFTKGSECQPEFRYKLQFTPCENVFFNHACFYPNDIQSMFPDDKELKLFNIESYMGIALSDQDENRLGLISLMHTTSFKNPALAEVFIAILVPRVEAELMRTISSGL